MTFDEERGGGARPRRARPTARRSSSPPRASCRYRWSHRSPAWGPSPGHRCSPAAGPTAGRPHRQARGVIGTGSTGVQLIPVVARQAGSCGVPALGGIHAARPVRRFEPGELDALKALRRDPHRTARPSGRRGAVRRFSVLLDSSAGRRSSPRPARSSCVPSRRTASGALNWGDIFFDIEANRMAAAVRRGGGPDREGPGNGGGVGARPSLRCKRPIIDQGYYETFNRDNVTLVDLRKGPIRESHRRVSTPSSAHELDVIVYATGFDAMTGALNRIDIAAGTDCRCANSGPGRGRSPIWGWPLPGSRTCSWFRVRGVLGLQRIRGCPRTTRRVDRRMYRLPAQQGHPHHRSAPTAQREWIDHATALVAPTVLVHPSCNSWYNGGNVPGKKRMYMGYTGGIPEYRRRCDEIAAADIPVSSWLGEVDMATQSGLGIARELARELGCCAAHGGRPEESTGWAPLSPRGARNSARSCSTNWC